MPDSAWSALARDYGPSCVMRPGISTALLADETQRQQSELGTLLAPILPRVAKRCLALDYGCGCGRFTSWLGRLTGLGAVGYDPCPQMLSQAPRDPRFAVYQYRLPQRYSFGVVFCFAVLGDPTLALDATAAEMANRMHPAGIIVVVDHMPPVEPPGRWWRFRPEQAYVDLFGTYGVQMKRIGSIMQLDDVLTVMVGTRE